MVDDREPETIGREVDRLGVQPAGSGEELEVSPSPRYTRRRSSEREVWGASVSMLRSWWPTRGHLIREALNARRG